MEFGSTITNPLLQVAVGAGEATIRHACSAEEGLEIKVEMEQYADGRDAILVTLRRGESVAHFSMLLRKFFDRAALWRVARRAWQHRGLDGAAPLRDLGFVGCRVGMN